MQSTVLKGFGVLENSFNRGDGAAIDWLESDLFDLEASSEVQEPEALDKNLLVK